MVNGQQQSGLKGLPPGDASDAFLEAAFAGTNSPSGWRAVNSRDFEDNNYNYTFQDSVLWVKDKHSFKFGFQYQRTYDKVKNDDTGSFLCRELQQQSDGAIQLRQYTECEHR